MADQEIITVSELDIADGASLSAEDQLLVHKAQEGKMQRVAFSGLFSQESASRISNDAALQLQINTMAGIDTDGETPTYRVVEKMDQSLKGVAGGVAELDSEGHVPASQLPSYVDDVIEGYYKRTDGKFYENYTPASVTHDIWSDGTSFLNSDLTAGTQPSGVAGVEVALGTVRKYGTDYYQLDTDWYQVTELTTSAITLGSTAEDDPAIIAALNASDDLTISYIPYVEDTGTYSDEIIPEAGKIYVDLRTNLTYRWGSTVYAPLSSDLALGETSATAYRGDRGKVAYDHSQVRGTGTVTPDNPHGLAPADIGLGNVPNVSTNDQAPTYEVASENAELVSGETLSTAFGKLAKIVRSFISHIANVANPHEVTKAQVGLGDVTNVATTSSIASGDSRNITSGAVYTALSDLDSAKQDAVTGGASSITDTDLTASKALVSDSNGKVAVSSVTSTELGYMSGVTSNVQSQLDSKIKPCTTIPVSPSIDETVLYLGTETGYVKGCIYQYDGTDWKIASGAGGGGTVAHFSTMSEWETARLITEGNDGYLADDSLVVIDSTNSIYIQNGTGSSATLTRLDGTIKKVTTMPSNPSSGDMVLYTGSTSGSLVKGHLYECRQFVTKCGQTEYDGDTLYFDENGNFITQPVGTITATTQIPPSWSIGNRLYQLCVADEYTSRVIGYLDTSDGDLYYDTVVFDFDNASVSDYEHIDEADNDYTLLSIVNAVTFTENKWVDVTAENRDAFIQSNFGNVENKSAATIISEITNSDVMSALAPTSGDAGKYLKADGTFDTPQTNDIFVGTQAEWDALTTAEQNEYSQANITDANSVVHVPVDVIADRNMNPVTSNAVYDALEPVDITSQVTVGNGITIRSDSLHVVRAGNVINVSFIIDSISDFTSNYIDILTGLPTPVLNQELSAICFTNNTIYYCGFFLGSSTLRMYERSSGFTRVQFCYIATE